MNSKPPSELDVVAASRSLWPDGVSLSNKKAPSKLDAYTAQLVGWFTPAPAGEGLTLEAGRKRLAERFGMKVSISRLCNWWKLYQQRQDVRSLLYRLGADRSAETQAAVILAAAQDDETRRVAISDASRAEKLAFILGRYFAG